MTQPERVIADPATDEAPTASTPTTADAVASALIDGLNDGRSILVLAAHEDDGDDADAALAKLVDAAPARIRTIASGPHTATAIEAAAPLLHALRPELCRAAAEQAEADTCACSLCGGDLDAVSEALGEALDRAAAMDRGVAYLFAPQVAPTEDALVFLARLAAAGRRLTRERLNAADGAPITGPVGAQIVMLAPAAALPTLRELGDGALRRAAERPIWARGSEAGHPPAAAPTGLEAHTVGDTDQSDRDSSVDVAPAQPAAMMAPQAEGPATLSALGSADAPSDLEALDEALIEAMMEEDFDAADAAKGKSTSGRAAEPTREREPGEIDMPFAEDATVGDVPAADAATTPADADAAPAADTPGFWSRLSLGAQQRPTTRERLEAPGRGNRRSTRLTSRLAPLRMPALLACGIAIGFVAMQSGGNAMVREAQIFQPAMVTGDTPQTNEDSVFRGMARSLVGLFESAARTAADTIAPTDGAAEGLNSFADDMFVARGDFERAEQVELAELAPEEARLQLTGRLDRALDEAEGHAAAGRFTAPAGANAYETLLRVYPLSPRDERLGGALSALVDYYEVEASKALSEGRYQAFHEANRVADRIRARLPI
ncbi:MAG: hypothetical protein AAF909_07695 [Pseudomonadota bacterium]